LRSITVSPFNDIADQMTLGLCAAVAPDANTATTFSYPALDFLRATKGP
jgi:hypothetical protein